MTSILDSSWQQYRIGAAVSRMALVAGALALLSGCGTLSSESIVSARTPVNEAVATTARQQTLMNIVRVYHNESPLILDVVEADEAVSVGGTAAGGVAGIGAIAGAMGGTLAGRTGSASGGLSAADGVTNRYVPLQGQALISQLASPITVETVNALYDSEWPLQSILDFAFNRLSPRVDDFRLVVDGLTSLNNDNAISIATAKSAFSKDDPVKDRLKVGDVTINTQQPAGGGGDTLNIYKIPARDAQEKGSGKAERVWDVLQGLYAGTQPYGETCGSKIHKSSVPLLELRNSPRTKSEDVIACATQKSYLGPVARTRTAIGILKYLVRQPKVAFLNKDEYQSIRHEPWNNPAQLRSCSTADVYMLNPHTLIGLQSEDQNVYFDVISSKEFTENKNVVWDWINSLGPNRCFFDYVGIRPHKVDLPGFAVALGSLERNILIVRTSSPVADAQTSWSDGTSYFSIMPDDSVSQRNLMLVAQFLTIQANSTPTPSLTTISPSGR